MIRKLRGRFGFEVERVDISAAGNERWYGLYCNDIPVVHIDGKEAFRHRVSERALRELLERDSTGADKSNGAEAGANSDRD